MNVQNKNYRVILVLILAFFTSLSAFAEDADKAEKADEKEAMPIVSIRTFDVKANAEGFMKMMDKAIKISRELYPEGSSKTEIIAGNVAWKYAHLVTVITTYPSLQEYVDAEEALRDKPELQAINEEMYDAGFHIVETTHNTLVAEY